MTSVFIEPSACGVFFILMTVLYEKLENRNYIVGYVGVLLTFSTQALLVLILLKLSNYVLVNSDKRKLIIPILLFTTIFQLTSSQIIERMNSDSFGHRVSGPIIAIEEIKTEFEFLEILFGKGIGSLSELTSKFSEKAPTTHNYFIDVIYEGGFIGFLLLIFAIIALTGWTNSINIFILFLAFGYRSPEIIGVAMLSQVNRRHLI